MGHPSKLGDLNDPLLSLTHMQHQAQEASVLEDRVGVGGKNISSGRLGGLISSIIKRGGHFFPIIFFL